MMRWTPSSDTEYSRLSQSNIDLCSRMSNTLPKSIIPSRYFRSDTANPHISSGEDSDLMVLDQTEKYDPDRDQTSSVNHHHVPQPPKHSRCDALNDNLDRRQKDLRSSRIETPTRSGKDMISCMHII